MKHLYFTCAAAALLLVSCASSPKKETKPQTAEPAQTESSVPASEAVSETAPAAADTEIPSERIEADSLSELPAEEIHSSEETHSTGSDAAAGLEPLVRDEPEIVAEPVPEIKSPEPKNTAAAQTAPAEKILVPVQPAPVQSATQKVQAKTAQPVKPAVMQQTKPAVRTITPESENKETGSHAEDTAAAPAEPEKKTDEAEPEMAPSRSITIDKGQYLDIVYPGTNWVYMGEKGGGKHFVFFGRKLGETDTSFTLRSKDSGTYQLHFYKNDNLTGKYIDDYLEVTVTDKQSDTTAHAQAPSYALAVPPRPAPAVSDAVPDETSSPEQAVQPKDSMKAGDSGSYEQKAKQTVSSVQKQTTEKPAENEDSVKTVVQTTESAPALSSPVINTREKTTLNSKNAQSETSSVNESAQTQNTAQNEISIDENTASENSDDLLKQAQDAYTAKNYPQALALLQLFFNTAVSRIDEGLYLQGQVLEAKSSVQNVKSAIDSYDILVKNWPQSSLWDKAHDRSIYLKRFFINIR